MDTDLKSYGLSHLELVLDELFAIPPVSIFPEVPAPQTVAELSERCGLSAPEVDATLKRIAKMSEDIEISPQALAAQLPAQEPELLLLDVREPWEFEAAHIPGSILLVSCEFSTLLPRLEAAARVVTICHHGVRSYSAAMWLRQRGITQAVSLAGGVDVWAQSIDTSMARY